MNEMACYMMIKGMAASSIIAALPQALIDRYQAVIEDTGVDDWTQAVFFLRAWNEYTRSLEMENEKLKEGLEC